MNKKIILTSFIALGFACPAMADTTTTYSSDTFPNASQGQYMQEDYTYTGAATETNMAGVYQDNATVYANAHYSNASYNVPAGKYLPADAEAVADCTDGSFCAGLQSPVNYNENSAQGIETCPSGYGHSDVNASADTQCYRTCDINNMGTSFANIAHASAVSGNDYYGAGTDTCVPTACVHGYHVKAAVTAPNLTTLIGVSEAGTGFGYLSNDGEVIENTDTYGISHNGEFVVDYGNKGKIHGYARCSTRSATDPFVGNNGDYVLQSDSTTETLPDSTGQYCYCQLDGYTPNGGTLQSLSAPWVFKYADGEAGSCAHGCARFCAGDLRYAISSDLAFRAAMFDSIESSPAMCEANTINISWDGATAASVSANNAGSVEYGSDIRTPETAIHVKGKVFEGWEFSTTAPANPVTEQSND